MKKEYDTPEFEIVSLNLSKDVLGASKWTPEETLVEETFDIDFD